MFGLKNPFTRRTEERAAQAQREAEERADAERAAQNPKPFAERHAAREAQRQAVHAAHAAELEEIRAAHTALDERCEREIAELERRAAAEDEAIEARLIEITDARFAPLVLDLFTEPNRQRALALADAFAELGADWRNAHGNADRLIRRVVYAALALVIAEAPATVNVVEDSVSKVWRAIGAGQSLVDLMSPLKRALEKRNPPEILATFGGLEGFVRDLARKGEPDQEALQRWELRIGTRAARERFERERAEAEAFEWQADKTFRDPTSPAVENSGTGGNAARI